MEDRDDELNRCAIPVCGAFLGAFTLPLTVLAVIWFLTEQPLWIPVAPNTAYPGFFENRQYFLFNQSLEFGPILGVLGTTLFTPLAKLRQIGLNRYGACCFLGYVALSYFSVFLKMRDGFPPLVLAGGSWVAAIVIIRYFWRRGAFKSLLAKSDS